MNSTVQTPDLTIEASALEDLLEPAPLLQVRLELTTRCNLRCVYCAVSQSTYDGQDMPAELAQRAIAAVTDLAAIHRPNVVHINGHGETTFIDGWTDICAPLLQNEIPLSLTTNLALRYSDEELKFLARMSSILVSIDTSDPELLRKTRRKVSRHQIVENINGIRKMALGMGRRPPEFRFSCGLYDRNSLVIEDLARLAVELGISQVGFWNLTKWEHANFPYHLTDVAESDRVYALDQISPEELRPRVEAIRRAIGIMERNRIDVHVNGDFVNALARSLEPAKEPAAAIPPATVENGLTRDCLDPWEYAEISVRGEVRPCCARPGVGNFNNESPEAILNGGPIRKLRSDLLNGTLDHHCAGCLLRSPTTVEHLRMRVHNRLHPTAANAELYPPTKAHMLFSAAFDQIRAGDREQAWALVSEALAIDPGIENANDPAHFEIRTHLPRVLASARFPLTLTWMAEFCREFGDHADRAALLKRYLEIAPDAADREQVLHDLATPAPSRLSQTLQKLSAAAGETWLMLRQTVRARTRIRSLIGRKHNR